jgi:hypothetical protein
MGREARRVPAHWQHPIDEMTGRYRPLFDGNYAEAARDWDESRLKWERGEFPDYACEDSKRLPYDQWAGRRPYSEDYMPQWAPEEARHLMMYETTSEGTPISPAFATPEELARWLVDNNASAFGSDTASYEAWLRVARGGYACSAIAVPGEGLVSGVEALTHLAPQA